MKLTRVLYAENYLIDTSVNEWNRKKEINSTAKSSWDHLVKFLQKKLKSQHLRWLDVREQLKRVRQWQSQIISKFVTHLDSLEDQLLEILMNRQKHDILLYFMHDYLRDVVIRTDTQSDTKFALITIVMTIERIELRSNEWKSREFKNLTLRTSHFNSNSVDFRITDTSQTFVSNAFYYNNNNNKRKRDDQKIDQSDRRDFSTRLNRTNLDRLSIVCWNCEKKEHRVNECRSSRQSRKDRD
jgi:hypothetical protein